MVLYNKMKAICFKMYAIVLIFSGFYLVLFTFCNQLYKKIVMSFRICTRENTKGKNTNE